ncbi:MULTISPECIES: TniQ family protein [Mycobacteriales]|nr:TniQ family protein [Nocardia nova]
MATYLLTRCEGTIGEHPAPVAATPAAGRVGSLSSWLSRLATTYAVPVRELLGPNLGVLAAIPDLLDQQPLPELFDALSQRTGVPVGRLAMMTLPGWVPCLFDSYLMAARDAEDTFDTMCSSIRCCWLPGSPLVSCWPAAVAGAARGFRPLA